LVALLLPQKTALLPAGFPLQSGAKAIGSINTLSVNTKPQKKLATP
tara:strand:- start:2988 stop:3125 length:138 start_codon:yes stop_codon:yes gene_type:complete